MLNKKGVFVSPVIFIVFALMAISVYNYSRNVDDSISYGIIVSASVDKGIYDLQKNILNQKNLATVSAYTCSQSNCYNSSDSQSVSGMKNCISGNLETSFENWEWDIVIEEQNGKILLEFSTMPFNATGINMSSHSIRIQKNLSQEYFWVC